MRRHVLVQRAAERDVDKLRAAADAEHRFARRAECVHQLDLVAVAQRIARPLRFERLFAVRERADVSATLQQEPVECLRIIGRAIA
jgi:hypothetical protein